MRFFTGAIASRVALGETEEGGKIEERRDRQAGGKRERERKRKDREKRRDRQAEGKRERERGKIEKREETDMETER